MLCGLTESKRKKKRGREREVGTGSTELDQPGCVRVGWPGSKEYRNRKREQWPSGLGRVNYRQPSRKEEKGEKICEDVCRYAQARKGGEEKAYVG